MNMYAIGKRKEDHGESFAMWHGPSPSEKEMLEVIGEDFNDYIVRFSGDPSANEDLKYELPWKWNPVSRGWRRYSPRVLNKRFDGDFIRMLGSDAVYIGRGSKWGNPYRIGGGVSREGSIVMFMEYLLNKPELLGSLHELKGKFLVCYCAPEACHGDVLIDLANPIEEKSDKPSWMFSKYLADSEDIDVKCNECERFIQAVNRSDPGGFTEIDYFHSGFIRGLAWGLYKSMRGSDHLTRLQYGLYKGSISIQDFGSEDDIPF